MLYTATHRNNTRKQYIGRDRGRHRKYTESHRIEAFPRCRAFLPFCPSPSPSKQHSMTTKLWHRQLTKSPPQGLVRLRLGKDQGAARAIQWGWDRKAIYTHVLYYTTTILYMLYVCRLHNSSPLFLLNHSISPSLQRDIIGETCILFRSVGRPPS